MEGFMGEQFYRVADVSELTAETMQCVSVAGKRLLIAQVQGRFYAADERCPHEDASLCKGSLHGTLVSCPLHGSRFDLTTGKVLEEPADSDLRTYPTEVREGVLYVAW
jgi:3-phenylpropionate/trans-cinnamate dioxygenase ferredoxin component